MKKLALYSIFTLFAGFGAKAQNCEILIKDCEKILKGKEQNFVSDGQVYTAFLDREKAEFKTTFFGGTTYRIATAAGKGDKYVIFTVKDLNGNVLFTNRKFNNSNYWDFKVPGTIPVVIETELDVNKRITGCVVMMIGFKR
ncbi:hypothetical protein [Fluviicola sp.]|jgi:hypothetical protein|uniref:hypothetical protein n=1 Tax=Fluviicola sp. TaxID=1917219 RepID=UPI002835E635|nr:hypothetical protein [Fluviicola sp.]MDR0801997.1 hypothetical protein [Fluviicola sp.]